MKWPRPKRLYSDVPHSARIYIYIYIYTPSLGSEITLFDREREQGRFRGSSEGARGSIEGARGSIEGARGSTGEHALGRSKRARVLAPQESLVWLHPTTRLQLAPVIFPTVVAWLSLLLLPRLLQLRRLLASSCAHEMLLYSHMHGHFSPPNHRNR